VSLIDVRINCPDEETARTIGGTLVERRLAACANVFPPIESTYHWRGTVEREREVPLLLKTRAALFDRLCEAAQRLHPYETPSILGVPIPLVNADYARWVEEETRPAESRARDA
jgi:periplasmic divalent cation tolerance protein